MSTSACLLKQAAFTHALMFRQNRQADPGYPPTNNPPPLFFLREFPLDLQMWSNTTFQCLHRRHEGTQRISGMSASGVGVRPSSQVWAPFSVGATNISGSII